MYEKIADARYATVALDPDWYQAFPDITLTAENKYICVFRRSIGHVGQNHTIMITRSPDGLTWAPPQIFAAPREEKENELWNCPKIQRFADNHLEITVDYHDLYLVQQEPCVFSWKSVDNGTKWAGPTLKDIYGILPTDYLINPANHQERIVGVHYRDDVTKRLKHVIYRSDNDGGNWWAEDVLAADGVHDYCEASLVPVNYPKQGDNPPAIIAFIRDNKMIEDIWSPMQMSISFDFGHTWRTPQEIPIIGHRPVAKLLNDGRLMLTYRDVAGNLCTALWIAQINLDLLATQRKLYFEDLFKAQKFYAIDFEDPGTSDTDFGYSGWVQNQSDGSIVTVYYTRKGQDTCFIKAAKFQPKNL